MKNIRILKKCTTTICCIDFFWQFGVVTNLIFVVDLSMLSLQERPQTGLIVGLYELDDGLETEPSHHRLLSVEATVLKHEKTIQNTIGWV